MDVPRPKRCQPGKRQPDLEEANILSGSRFQRCSASRVANSSPEPSRLIARVFLLRSCSLRTSGTETIT
jgi:hypothetical protein